MKNFCKNESGIALIMVLVLLVLVGGLTAALLNSAVFNIFFSGDEVDRAQAFYSADAGIEYLKENVSFSEIKDWYEQNNNNNNPLASYNGDKIRFELHLTKLEGDNATFKSIGNYNGEEAVIYIDINRYFSDEPFQVETGQTDGDFLKGQAKQMWEDGYVNLTREISPSKEHWYYDYRYTYNEDNGDKNGIKTLDNEYKYDKNILPTEDDFIRYYSDSRRYNFGYEENLNDIYGNDFNGDDTFKNDFEEDYKKFFEEVLKFGECEENDNGEAGDGDNEHGYCYNDVYFTAFIQEEISIGNPGGGQTPGDSWDENLINTILVVDGGVDITIRPQVRIENSIIIVKDASIKFTGSPTEHLKSSMFYIYQEDIEIDDDPDDPHVAGTYKFWDLDDLPDFGDVYDIEKFLENTVPENWRQGL